MSTSTSGTKRKLEETDIENVDEIPRKLLKTEKEEPVKAEEAVKAEQATPVAEDAVSAIKSESKNETPIDDNTNDEKKDKNDTNDTNDSKTQIGKTILKLPTKKLDPANEQKLQAQIEWYFGDSNLSMDGHILYESKKNNGFFPLRGLMRFNAVCELTNDIDAVRSIIRSSSKLQLNETETGVQRHPSLGDPPTKEDILTRTIFAKGFHPTMSMQDLRTFWQQQVDADKADSVLSVRTVKEYFSVGIVEDNKPKTVKRFMGQCLVEFDTVELAEKMSKMTFNCHHRLICCAMHASYYYSDIEWNIKRQYHPFVSQTVLAVKNVPIHSTHCDVKHWAETALFVHKQMNNPNGVAAVHKERNKCMALLRLTAESEVQACVKRLRSRPLMGSYPMVRVLDDEQAQKVWNKVAQIDYHKNESVEMVVTPKPRPSRDHHHHHNSNSNKKNAPKENEKENVKEAVEEKENEAKETKETTIVDEQSKSDKLENDEC